jgi:hypothetical protein
MIIGVKDRFHYCYFPMPYDRKASLKLTYLKTSKNGTMEIPCKVTVYYSEISRKEMKKEAFSCTGFIWKKSDQDLNL